MDGFELGWVVGFLEGEGSFYCGITPPSAKFPWIKTRVHVVASQVQREPLDRLVRYSGAGRIHGPRRPQGSNPSPKWSPIYSWLLEGKAGADFMRLVREHMSPRRQTQIDKALARYDSRPKKDQQATLAKVWATRRARYGTSGLRLVKAG